MSEWLDRMDNIHPRTAPPERAIFGERQGQTMAVTSTKERYGSAAVALHWLTALAIISTLMLGFAAAKADVAAQEIPLLRLHAIAGIAALALTLVRLGWWALYDAKPDMVVDAGQKRRALARIVHALLYLLPVVGAALGLAMLFQSGAHHILLGQIEEELPNFWTFGPRLPHGIIARLIILFVLVHIIGAAINAARKPREYLGRMWF